MHDALRANAPSEWLTRKVCANCRRSPLPGVPAANVDRDEFGVAG